MIEAGVGKMMGNPFATGLDGVGVGLFIFRMFSTVMGSPVRQISEKEVYGYDAPFPNDSFKAGARRFPEIVPTPDSDPTGR